MNQIPKMTREEALEQFSGLYRGMMRTDIEVTLSEQDSIMKVMQMLLDYVRVLDESDALMEKAFEIVKERYKKKHESKI
jgi:hypothetical protein